MGTVIINDSAKKVARDLKTILEGSTIRCGDYPTMTWVNRDELKELVARLEQLPEKEKRR